MKKLLFALAALSVLAVPLPAKEFKLPKEKPIFTITFPDKWKVTYEDESVDALSPDEAIAIYAQTDDADTIEDSVKESIKYLEEQGVKLKPDTQTETDGEHNGMKLATIGWKGTDKDGDCSVSLVFIQVTDETAMTLIYWATDDMVKKHEKEINGVLDSMKSLVAKKGKKQAAEKEEKEEK